METLVKSIENMQEDLIGQGISFLIELENIFGKDKFFKYVYNYLGTDTK